jgi:hypothetical protein
MAAFGHKNRQRHHVSRIILHRNGIWGTYQSDRVTTVNFVVVVNHPLSLFVHFSSHHFPRVGFLFEQSYFFVTCVLSVEGDVDIVAGITKLGERVAGNTKLE